MNPGPWIAHSIHVAEAAEAIAKYHPQLDPEAAFILGALHDIGRRFGVSDMRHVLDGYNFLKGEGFDDAAQICLTHSFPILQAEAGAGKWDGTDEELNQLQTLLDQAVITDYDRLIQLCDSLATAEGIMLMEKRLLDVALRHGCNKFTKPRWQAFLDLKIYFESKINAPIYSVLPGVLQNTFGFDPCREQHLPS